VRLTAKECAALRMFARPSPHRARPSPHRSYAGIHGRTLHALERKGLIAPSPRGRSLTPTGRAELHVPNIFDDLFKGE